MRPLVGALVCALLLGCSGQVMEGGTGAPSSAAERPAPSGAGLRLSTGQDTGGGLAALPDHCQVRPGPLPDPACTPGAIDPTVTVSELCPTPHTRARRPPESYTGPLKRQLMARYGESGSTSGYELDHLVPLELGGAGWDVHNLWPEPGASPNAKDAVEDAANRAVCSGRLSLARAQREIAGDWMALGRELGVSG
ncbi:MAG TPA: hypothetical protein VFD49_17640 [Candidatus Dormibacteraeota bacterium]|nr:hypothetical protein [Candidatus Dormibacteraeota bacterium]